MWSSTLQIDWKQRFFVPTDEESGVVVLSDLLSHYPVLARDVLIEDEPIAEIEPAELMPPQIVNLDDWFVSVVTKVEKIAEPSPGDEKRAQPVFVLTSPPDRFPPRPQTGEQRDRQLALEFE